MMFGLARKRTPSAPPLSLSQNASGLPAPLPLKQIHPGRWRFSLFLNADLDTTEPIRAALARAARALDAATLELPAYTEGEDYIDGKLMLRGGRVDIYFEFILGFIDLSSDDEVLLQEAGGELCSAWDATSWVQRTW